jgi:DNA-directed RNA polymerase III subunit RPC3
VRFSEYTVKSVRENLVVLIKHGIVYFSEPLDDIRDDKRDATYYEIDTQKIMMRLRMGRIMRVTEEHYGKTVSSVQLNAS